MIKNSQENQIKITKLLHNPMTRDELAREFGINERQLRVYLKEDKCTFCDVEFPLFTTKNKSSNKTKKERRGKQKVEILSSSKKQEKVKDNDVYMKSTVNPIVLPLNMTEVFALTNLILDQMKGTDYYEIYKQIADKIYPQLSDYAKTRIGPNKHGLTEDLPITFTEEEGLYKDFMPQAMLYALKSNRNIKITMIDGKEIVGKVDTNDKKTKIVCSNKTYVYDKIKDKIKSVEEI